MRQMLDNLLAGARPDLNTLTWAFGEAVPALRRLKDTPQDPEWHAEGDVYTHTDMVLDELYRSFDTDIGKSIPPVVQRELILGALFHDVAKPWTTKRMEIRGVERVAAPRHEAQGRSLIAPILVDSGLSWESLWHVMGIVGCHQEPKLLVVKDKPPGEYKRLSRKVDPFRVTFMEQADMRGRICPDLPKQLEHLEMYLLGSEEYAPPGWLEEWRAHFADLTADRPLAFRDRVFGEAIRAVEDGKIATPEEGGFLVFQENATPPELVVLCGPSGSGKSTFIEKHLPDYEVVSLDNLREEMSGDRADQTMNGQVRQEAQFRLKAALRPGRKVVWDATNLRKDFRSMVCETGFAYKALVTLVVIHLKPEDNAARNQKRTHAVPPKVLASQLEGWEYPDVDEAHRMLVLDGTGQVRGAFGLTEGLP